jgi:hypothetical protein
MYYVIYISASARLLNEAELKAILVQNELKNKYNQVTGLLLYNAGIFMQVIEGARASVLKTFKRIESDIWQKEIIKLGEGPLRQRLFSSWKMSFCTDHPDAFAGCESFVAPVSLQYIEDIMHPCADMIKIFLESNRLTYKGYANVDHDK